MTAPFLWLLSRFVLLVAFSLSLDACCLLMARLLVDGCLLQVAGCLMLVAGGRWLTEHRWLAVAGCLLTVGDSLMVAAAC